MQLHPLLQQCHLIYRAAGATIDLDIIPTKSPGLNHAQRDFHIHHRWLDYTYVHSRRKTCPLFQSRANDEDGTCDCAIERILYILLAELGGELGVVERKCVEQTAADLFKTMPRDVKVQEGEAGVEVQWRIATESYCGGFEVVVCGAGYDGAGHLYFQSEEGEEGDRDTEVNDATATLSPAKDSSTVHSTLDESPAPSGPRVFQGTTKTTSYTLDPTTTPLQPGSKYTLLLRPTQSQAFFSPALPFRFPVPAPTNLTCTRNQRSLVVRWDSPINARFLVTISDNAKWGHVSDGIEGNEYLVPDVVTEEFWVRVVAESGGVYSAHTTVVVPPLCEESGLEEGASPQEVLRAGRVEVPLDDSAGSTAGFDVDQGVYTTGFAPAYPEDFDHEASQASDASSDGISADDELYYTGCSSGSPSDSETSQDGERSPEGYALQWEGKSVTPHVLNFFVMANG